MNAAPHPGETSSGGSNPDASASRVPNPGVVAAETRRRLTEENKPVEQKLEELQATVDALLARDADGAAEAEILEQAQRTVAEALGQQ